MCACSENDKISFDEEQSIIRNILCGKKDDFNLFVLAFQGRIFRLIMRMVGNESIAKDLVQDTFLKAYVNLDSFRLESRFITWISRIAINTTNSYLGSSQHKARQKNITLTDYMSDEDNAAYKFDCYDNEAVHNIERLIRELPVKLRDVMILCGLEQQSYEDAATILQVPVGTIRSRLNRARLEVKNKYFAKK